MNSEGYNGWTNYETWLVVVHIENTESLYHYIHNFIKEKIRNPPQRMEMTSMLMEKIEDLLDKLQPKKCETIWTDLMSAARGRINFYEIAESLLNDEEYPKH